MLKGVKSKENVRLVLFDLDDTLFDSETKFKIAEKKCFNYLRQKYPIITFDLFDKTYKEAREEIHHHLKGTASAHDRLLYFQRLFELLGLTIQPEIIYEMTKIYWDYVYGNIKLYPNVAGTLKLLKENNIKIGIVTNLLIATQIDKLRRLGITRYIDFIVSSEEARVEKPDPLIFKMALKKGGHTANETIMIGDSIKSDILGAKGVGITAVLKNTFGIKDTEPADYVINDFRELAGILNIKKKAHRNKKMLVFDMMGTIFKEGHVIRKILIPLLEKRGYNIQYPKLKEEYVKYTLGQIKGERFWEIVPREVEQEFLDRLVLDKSLFEVFDKLKKHYLFGILSNIPKPWEDYLLKKYDLGKFFDTVTFSAYYHTRKPSEKLYREFVNSARVKPQNCYFVDDRLENLREARFLSMKTIWMKKEKPETLFIPDFAITKLSELLNIL